MTKSKWLQETAGFMDQLRSAISVLNDLEKRGIEDLDPAISALIRCNALFLTSGDENGLRWSVQLLQGIICFAPYKLKSPDDLFSALVRCFHEVLAEGDEHEEEESVSALVAFHVGTAAKMECQGRTWFSKCFREAKTDRLRYEAATGLGKTAISAQESLEWFQVANKYATGASRTLASYRVARALALLERHNEAFATMNNGTVGTSARFGLGLVTMLEAVAKQTDGISSLEDVIAAFSKARTMLPPLMPNLEMKLSSYFRGSGSGSPFFSLRLLVKFSGLDMFAKYILLTYASELGKPEEGAPEELELSIFVMELYAESRKAMATLQNSGVEAFMDPRPALEQGIDLLYSRDPTGALDPLVLCQQLSIKAGHSTGFDLISYFIDHYVESREAEGASHGELLDRLVAAFEKVSHLEEVPEAWAAYHLGRAGAEDGKVSEEHYECLKLALDKSRTPYLSYRVCEALGDATVDLRMKLDYFETMRVHALVMGEMEYVLSAHFTLFNFLVLESRQLDKALKVHEELGQLMQMKYLKSSGLDATLCQGMAAFMMGMMIGALQGALRPAMQEAVSHLESLQLHVSANELLLYITNTDGDKWSLKKNRMAQNAYSNALRFTRDSFQQLPVRVTEEFDQVEAALGQLDNMDKLSSLLISAGSLEEAEEEVATALEFIQEHGEMIGSRSVISAISLRMRLAELVSAHHQRSRRPDADDGVAKEATLQMIEEFINEARRLANMAARAKHLASHVSVFYGQILLLLGERSSALIEMEKLPCEILVEDSTNFGPLSAGRIEMMENIKLRLRFLQWFYCDSGDIQKGLVWAERERARDLLFSLKSVEDMQSHAKLLLEFDSDYARAWSEIETTSEMLGKDTVVLIISLSNMTGNHNDPDLIVTYLLHSGSELRCQWYRQQEPLLTSVDGLLHLISKSHSRAEEILEEYYNVLIRPFSEDLERIQPKKIIFVPSEEFCKLPFAALKDDSTPEKPYLIQRYATVTSYSLKLLKQCLLREKDVARQQLQEPLPALLVLADSVPGLDDLPKALQEIELVRDALEGVGYGINRLDNEEATEQKVLNSLTESSWVHFASHAEANSEFPDGAIRLWTRPLMGTVIQELKSPLKASAVVISACSSGVGRVFAEGVMALSRSFHIIGAPSVLVALWPVDDDATCLLMELTYRNLAGGMEIAEAMQAAMVKTMEELEDLMRARQRPIPGSKLKYWAPFFISGSPSVKLILS